VGVFRWYSSRDIPEQFDLRLRGWAMPDIGEPSAADGIGLIDTTQFDSLDWVRLMTDYSIEARRVLLPVGVKSALRRASLLGAGFGDAVGDQPSLAELSARAKRVAELALWVPRHRMLSRLRLDLLARDAFADGKAVGLNPREFGLLWRLADEPDEVVSKRSLFRDVWRLGFVPETNSIAVHMSRLRGKLATAGFRGVVETVNGGYLLRTAAFGTAMPMVRRQTPLACDYSRPQGRYRPAPDGAAYSG
jgi:DNA-binding response OmpR family regulator